MKFTYKMQPYIGHSYGQFNGDLVVRRSQTSNLFSMNLKRDFTRMLICRLIGEHCSKDGRTTRFNSYCAGTLCTI